MRSAKSAPRVFFETYTKDFSTEELGKLFTEPSLRTVVLILLAAIGLYIVFGLLILPLRCWWQAYLFRYLVAHSRAGNVLTILHTEVPKALEGRGIGSSLTRGVLDTARSQGLKVSALCPFAKGYIERHPEYADLRP